MTTTNLSKKARPSKVARTFRHLERELLRRAAHHRQLPLEMRQVFKRDLEKQESSLVAPNDIPVQEDSWLERKDIERAANVSIAVLRAFAFLGGLLKPRAHRASTRTVKSAACALDLLSMLVPKRVANEEIGDAMEQIHAMVKARRPRWFIYLKVATTFFWVFMHTALHYATQVAGIIGKAAGGKGD